jgi:hypothetical protein
MMAFAAVSYLPKRIGPVGRAAAQGAFRVSKSVYGTLETVDPKAGGIIMKRSPCRRRRARHEGSRPVPREGIIPALHRRGR